MDPHREEAQLGLGICLLHQEKPEPAIVCFDKVLARQPAHETAPFGKAVSLQLLWKFDEATAIYLKILGKNPQSEECLVNLITIGMARKDHALIQKYSEQLLTMRPFSQAALEGLATCAFHSGNEYRSRARYCAAKLVEFTPDHFERWFNLGVAEQKCGSPAGSGCKAYSEAVRVRPDAKQAHVNLGIVRQETGRAEAGSRNRTSARCRSLRIWRDVIYNLASVLEQQGEKEEAERLYVKLLSRNPEWEDAWFRLGYLRLQRADHRGGAEAFQACVRKRVAVAGSAVEPGLVATGIWETTTAPPRRLKPCSNPIRNPSTRCAVWPRWRWNARI